MSVPQDPTAPDDGSAAGEGQPRRSALVLVAAAAAGLVVVTAATAAVVGADGRVLPNTSVAGVEVGRLTPDAARRALEEASDDGRLPPVPASIAVTTPDGVVALGTSALGLRHDLDASVARAVARGRSGRPGDVAERLRSLRTRADLDAALAIDAAAVRLAIASLATELDREPTAGTLRVDPTSLAVEVVAPRVGVRVRREEAQARLVSALESGDRRGVALVADVRPALAPRAAIVGIAERLTAALASELVLVRDGSSVAVLPGELAAAVTIGTEPDGRGGMRPVLRLDPLVLARGPGPRLVVAVERDAVDAQLVLPDADASFSDLGSTAFAPIPAPIRLDAGRTELRYRMDLTARQLARMVATGRGTETADLRETPAERPPEAFTQHLLPTHVIGTFTTFHPAGAPRTINIRRLADTIDGALVAPGEEFSVNAASGARRCTDGYVLAGTIIRGELVDTCGGGVSQFGTTLYNAAFFAGLPTTAWQPHSFFISRYPMGREATLSYPDLDVRFMNDTAGWIAIRTAHTPTSVTVTLLGVPAWSEVRAVHSEPRDARPYPTEFRAVGDLPPGRQRVVQAGGGGFTVDVTRIRVPHDAGTALTERYRTVYRPQTRIVEVGAGGDRPEAD